MVCAGVTRVPIGGLRMYAKRTHLSQSWHFLLVFIRFFQLLVLDCT